MAFDFKWANRGSQQNPDMGGYSTARQNALAGASAGQQMAGYRPNVSASTPFNNEQLAQQNYDQFQDSLQAKRQQLASLEEQLKQIDSQIAELENGAADEERSIAAKLAEIGDTSLYQGIVARQQNQAAQQKTNASSIDNMLFEADKLSWGLNSKSDEERGIVKQNIQAVLDRAKQVAEQTGTPLPSKYAELERKLEESDKASSALESDRKRSNELFLLARNGGLRDYHIKEMEDYVKRNPNSEIATQYIQLIEKYQGQTQESKAAKYKRKKAALDLYYSLTSLPNEEFTRRIANLSPYNRKLLEDFYPEILK